jgi:hypothetical protein
MGLLLESESAASGAYQVQHCNKNHLTRKLIISERSFLYLRCSCFIIASALRVSVIIPSLPFLVICNASNDTVHSQLNLLFCAFSSNMLLSFFRS